MKIKYHGMNPPRELSKFSLPEMDSPLPQELSLVQKRPQFRIWEIKFQIDWIEMVH